MAPAGAVVVCDRYLASSIAYGESQGLDAGVAAAAQQYLPQPTLTFVLDIAPEAACAQAVGPRQDTNATWRCFTCASQLSAPGPGAWLGADRRAADKDAVSAAVVSAVRSRLAQP